MLNEIVQGFTGVIHWAIDIIMFWKDWDQISQFLLLAVVFASLFLWRMMSKVIKKDSAYKKHVEELKKKYYND
jgi:DMSO/TMAO reductase YedYZ heme-binding membrane subunit